jgi:prolyl-tRNA synthetase
MRLSEMLISTLREDPADAEVPSHRLLARGGYIVKVAAGIYTYSPLMWRVVKKFAQIVREEMDRQGAQEVMMPIAHPRELWDSSGRWDRYVAAGIMFTLKDRKGAELCLGPTHEEVITSYVNAAVNSYKQLPQNLYQIQDKFRDEIRPRFGLMRGREFIMMDAYTFDVDGAGLDVAYGKMHRAYCAIFDRCGLNYTIVQADAGAIGGSGSEEFMVLAETGEDAILYCEESGYAANVERANSQLLDAPTGGEPAALEKQSTPDIRTVAQLEEFFGMPAARMAKTVLYKSTYAEREDLVAVLMRGDQEINEVKLTNTLDALSVRLADDESIGKATGAEVGFSGPVNLPSEIRLLADESLRDRTNLLTGSNQTGYHCVNVNLGRDCPMPEFADLRLARPGDTCLSGKGVLKSARGIEVGHIFKLGTKYSAAMGATFMDQGGKPQPFVMGCYGIGVSRTPAAAVEQGHDEMGIVWPIPLAPFEVVVAVLDPRREEQSALGERLYTQLQALGVDVCLDDRPMRPGAKFKDLELLGFPLQVVVGRKAADGVVEFVVRKGLVKEDIDADAVVERCQTAVNRGKSSA